MCAPSEKLNTRGWFDLPTDSAFQVQRSLKGYLVSPSWSMKRASDDKSCAGLIAPLVWPFVSVLMLGQEVERNWQHRDDSLNTVLARFACSACDIRLLIQQRDYVPMGRGPRVVWHIWRAIDQDGLGQ